MLAEDETQKNNRLDEKKQFHVSSFAQRQIKVSKKAFLLLQND